MPDLEGLSAAALLAVVLIVVLKDIVRPALIKKNGGMSPETRDQILLELAQYTKDLHKWHAPDSGGEQAWRGGIIQRELQEMNKRHSEMTQSINSFSREVAGTNRRLDIILTNRPEALVK